MVLGNSKLPLATRRSKVFFKKAHQGSTGVLIMLLRKNVKEEENTSSKEEERGGKEGNIFIFLLLFSKERWAK